MSYRVVLKPEAKNQLVSGYGVLSTSGEVGSKNKGLEYQPDVEDVCEILRYLEKSDSSYCDQLPERKSSFTKTNCQIPRGPMFDRNAHRWWLSRFGVEDHIVSALSNQVQPERVTSAAYIKSDHLMHQNLHGESNISTVDAPGSLGLRRTHLHVSSSIPARHYKPVLRNGTFAWGENFTFSSFPSEQSYADGQHVSPVDIDKLRPSSLLSVPPVQRLHLVEPFRPVPLGIKELILERAHLLSPSENMLLLHTGKGSYPFGVLSSGRRILKAASRRIYVNGLDTIPAIVAESAPESIPAVNPDPSTQRQTSNGSGSDYVSTMLTISEDIRKVREAVEDNDVANENADATRTNDDQSDYGFSAGYIIDPEDLEHMARKHNEAIESEDDGRAKYDGAKEDDGDVGDYCGSAGDCDMTQSQVTFSPLYQSQTFADMDDEPYGQGELGPSQLSIEFTQDSADNAAEEENVVDGNTHFTSEAHDTREDVDEAEYSLEGNAQFQAFENMLGRHLEGITDAVLEMVFNFMEPYAYIAQDGDLPTEDASISTPSVQNTDTVTQKQREKRKRMYDIQFRRRSQALVWAPRSQASFVKEWRHEKTGHAQAIEADMQRKVTWEHVLSAVQSISHDEDMCTASDLIRRFGGPVGRPDSDICSSTGSASASSAEVIGEHKRQKRYHEGDSNEILVTKKGSSYDDNAAVHDDASENGVDEESSNVCESAHELDGGDNVDDEDEAILAFLDSQLQNELYGTQRQTPVEVHSLLPPLHLTSSVVRRVQSRILSLFAISDKSHDGTVKQTPVRSKSKGPTTTGYDKTQLQQAMMAPTYPHSGNIAAVRETE